MVKPLDAEEADEAKDNPDTVESGRMIRVLSEEEPLCFRGGMNRRRFDRYGAKRTVSFTSRGRSGGADGRIKIFKAGRTAFLVEKVGR